MGDSGSRRFYGRRVTSASWQSQPMIEIVAMILCCILGAAVVVLTIAQPYPAFQDFPPWTYLGVVAKQLLISGESSNLAFAPYPVPNSLFVFAVAGLSFFFSPLASAKVCLVVYFATAVAVWSRALPKDSEYKWSASLVALSSLLASSAFSNGFISHQLGLVCFLGIFSTMRRGQYFALGVLLVLAFLSHGIVFVSSFVLFGIMILRSKQLLRGLAVAIVPASLCLWYLVRKPSLAIDGIALSASELFQHPFELVKYKLYTIAKQGPFQSFVLANGESFWEKYDFLYKFGIALNSVWALLIIFCIIRFFQKSSEAVQKWFVGISLGLLVFLPPELSAIVNPGERFLAPALAVILIFLASKDAVAEGIRVGLVMLVTLGFPLTLSFYFKAAFDSASLREAAVPITLDSKSLGSKNRIQAQIYSKTSQIYFTRKPFLSFAYYEDLKDLHPPYSLPFQTGPIIERQGINKGP